MGVAVTGGFEADPPVPHVRLLGGSDTSDAELRAAARALSREVGAPFVSRSYRAPYALVAWSDGPVGVDLERVEPCDDAFADLICTPAERAGLARRASRDEYLTTLWSGKEALTKALGDALQYAPARVEAPLGWPDGRAGAWRAVQPACPPGHVAWLVWRAPARSL